MVLIHPQKGTKNSLAMEASGYDISKAAVSLLIVHQILQLVWRSLIYDFSAWHN